MMYIDFLGSWVINLTPHDVVVRRPDCGELIIPVHGSAIRLAESREHLAGDGLQRVTLSFPDGIPAPATSMDGKPVFYVVSSLVAQAAALAGRSDFIAPDTNRAERDANGRILSVPGFVCF
jgi:hypothetical protein